MSGPLGWDSWSLRPAYRQPCRSKPRADRYSCRRHQGPRGYLLNMSALESLSCSLPQGTLTTRVGTGRAVEVPVCASTDIVLGDSFPTVAFAKSICQTRIP